MYGLTYTMIDGHSKVTSITAPAGELIQLTYTNGVLNVDQLTYEQSDIVIDCGNWIEKQWIEHPKALIRTARAGLNYKINRRKRLRS